jgi:hypothetical protein
VVVIVGVEVVMVGCRRYFVRTRSRLPIQDTSLRAISLLLLFKMSDEALSKARTRWQKNDAVVMQAFVDSFVLRGASFGSLEDRQIRTRQEHRDIQRTCLRCRESLNASNEFSV